MLQLLVGAVLGGVVTAALCQRRRPPQVSRRACFHEAGHFVHLISNKRRCAAIRVAGETGAVTPEQDLDLAGGLEGKDPPGEDLLELLADNLLAGVVAERVLGDGADAWSAPEAWRDEVAKARSVAVKFWNGNSSATGLDVVDALGVVRELRRRRGGAMAMDDCLTDVAERAASVARGLGDRWEVVERVAMSVQKAPWHRYADSEYLGESLSNLQVTTWT